MIELATEMLWVLEYPYQQDAENPVQLARIIVAAERCQLRDNVWFFERGDDARYAGTFSQAIPNLPHMTVRRILPGEEIP